MIDLIEVLEKKISKILKRLEILEEENKRLKEELKKERKIKEEAVRRIDSLLQKIEEMDITSFNEKV